MPTIDQVTLQPGLPPPRPERAPQRGNHQLCAQTAQARTDDTSRVLAGIPDRPRAATMDVLESPWPTCVTPWLYIGGARQAACAPRLRQLRITHVVNVARELPVSHPGQFYYLHIAARDTTQERLAPRFFDVASYVQRAQIQGGKTLIHCHEGLSRSATFVLATRIINERMPLLDAYDDLRRLRPIEPNPQFLFELRQLEMRWLGSFTREKLTLLDEVQRPSAQVLAREQVLELLAKAAQLPRSSVRGFGEFKRALVVMRGFFHQRDLLERSVLGGLEMYATDSSNDAAARAALATLLVGLDRRLSAGESMIYPRLEQLFDGALFKELSIDAPHMPRHANALLEIVARR